MLERDPGLLEQLEDCPQGTLEGVTNRVVWADRSPVQGSNGKRGRWNSPDGDFEILNTSLLAEGADAEFESFWSLFEQRPDRKALNWKLKVRLKRVVELSFEDLERLGVRQADYQDRNYSRTQEISDGLNYLGCDGLIVPSARYDCKNLIIYTQNLDKDSFVDEVEWKEFQWSDRGDDDMPS